MRWERDENFVEIVSGHSVDVQNAAWHINTNLDFKDLPVEFRKQVPTTNEEGYKELERSVSRWAERNGYQLVGDTH